MGRDAYVVRIAALFAEVGHARFHARERLMLVSLGVFTATEIAIEAARDQGKFLAAVVAHFGGLFGLAGRFDAAHTGGIGTNCLGCFGRGRYFGKRRVAGGGLHLEPLPLALSECIRDFLIRVFPAGFP
jgi:hypothetical protein